LAKLQQINLSGNSTSSETRHGLTTNFFFCQWFVKVFDLRITHIKRDKLYTLAHCNWVNSDINYDYDDKIGPSHTFFLNRNQWVE
jgi:hypothetical protein